MVPGCSLFLRCSFSHILCSLKVGCLLYPVSQSSIFMVSFCCLYMWILGYHSWWTDWTAATSWLSANQPIRGHMRGSSVFDYCLKTFCGNKEEASLKLLEKVLEAWKRSPEWSTHEGLDQQHLSWEHKDETVENSYLWLCSEKWFWSTGLCM